MRKTFLLFLFILVLCSVVYPLDVLWQGRPSVVPASPSVGQAVSITATFHVSDGPVRNLRVTGGVDGAIIIDRTWASIENNLNRTVNFRWVATTGNHTIFFQIDPERRLNGQIAGNDRLEISINIGGTDTPPPQELLTSNINIAETHNTILMPDPCRQYRDAPTDLIITDVSFNHVSLAPGPSIYEYRFKIKNLGQRCLTSLSWKMEEYRKACPHCPSGKYDSSGGEYVLKGGEEKIIVGRVTMAQVPISISYKAHWTGTMHHASCVHLVVDPKNDVPELNEDNNITINTSHNNRINETCWFLDWQEGD